MNFTNSGSDFFPAASNAQGHIMRIHDKGDYAYDLEQSIDPSTQLRTGWNFHIFRLRPVEQIIEDGQASTREDAEKLAKRAITRMLQKERKVA
jgi:hypothetical protein